VSRLTHATEVQNSTFSVSHWNMDHRILWFTGRLPHAIRLGPITGQDTNLSCHVLTFTFCCIMWCDYNPPMLKTDWVKDRRTSCSYQIHGWLNACTDTNKWSQSVLPCTWWIAENRILFIVQAHNKFNFCIQLLFIVILYFYKWNFWVVFAIDLLCNILCTVAYIKPIYWLVLDSVWWTEHNNFEL